jgi:flagellar biosynthesis chaperone FliJ
MLKIKPNLNVVAILATIVGLVFVIGCGSSLEKKQMTDFIQEFGKTVDAYAKAEDGQKAELQKKVESSMDKWTEMKIEMGSELTPQALDKLDAEYQRLAKEFKTIAGKS